MSSVADDLRRQTLARVLALPMAARVPSVGPPVIAARDLILLKLYVYVALAEVLDASLLTCDRRLAHAPGMKKRAILI